MTPRSLRPRLPLDSLVQPTRTKRELRLGVALRKALANGYGRAELVADLFAGLVVGIVALPLSMALGIAVGAPPQAGLYTTIIAGGLVALLGGCKFQVTGPTAAFVVILAPIVTRHGLSGLLTAGMMAGVILVGMGLMRLGRLIQYIPYPVTTGFTTGIAVVIATLQIKDLFGLQIVSMPEHYTAKLHALWTARGGTSLVEFGVAAVTLACLLLVPKLTRRVPAPLIALVGVSGCVALLAKVVPGFEPSTIGTHFHTVVDGVTVGGIPQGLPRPALPWGSEFSFALVEDLLPAAFAIAMLGAIESLLSAVIADGLTGKKHDPDAELIALGVGNIAAPIFGGIAATGALARTATNIRAGAKSPIAAIVHAAVVLLSVLLLGPLVAYVPMASLAALLIVVAYNMSEVHAFAGIVRVAPKSDVAVLITCFALTVLFDMVIAIAVGVVLAALLFMRRMAELTQPRAIFEGESTEHDVAVPHGVGLYEIRGPLFFGAAQKAMDALEAGRANNYDVLVLSLGSVSVIDATGLAALDNAIASLRRQNKRVVLAGPLPKPQRMFDKAGLDKRHTGLVFAPDLPTALAVAATLVGPSLAAKGAA